jgi:flavin-dependent dehydrogenase
VSIALQSIPDDSSSYTSGGENLEPQVLVLGAGLGGIAAALALRRRGWNVTIVEKEPSPWHRVGESFDWETPVLLEQLGLNLEELREQDILTYKPGVIVWSDTTCRRNEAWLIADRHYMRLIKRNYMTYHGNRHLLDQHLSEMMQAEGCRLVTQRIRKVHTLGQSVEKVELESGEELRAPFYIDASGRARLIMRSAGIHSTAQGEKMVSLWRRHHHHYDEKGTRLYLVDVGEQVFWTWNIHVGAETTDIGMVLPATLYRSLANGGSKGNGGADTKEANDIYWKLLEKVKLLTEFADQSRTAGPLQTCSFQNTMADRAGGDNWLAVGEAAYVIDPISSGGTTLALRSGKFAANILDKALAEGKTQLPESDRHFYHQRLAVQVRFVNGALDDLFRFRRLGYRLGMPIYVRLLTWPQFHINRISAGFELRSRFGLLLLRLLRVLLGDGVRGFLYILRTVYRES